MPAQRQFLLVVYDISDDRRRTRLHNRLLDFGTPVQYSAFEFWLTQGELNRLKKAIQRVIKPRIDNVRYYYLCAACQDKVESNGEEEIHSEPPSAILV